MNSQFNQQRRNARSLRRAFTLVEMLVAMTLVLLMMTLFGEIFSLATGSMNLQRAIAENDQQIRTLTTVLRGDLQKRTFRNAVPFFPLENQDDPTTSFHGREGYFYISLNSSNNAVDNVLQFTVRSTILDELIDDTPYYGKATRLPGGFLANGNQPEHDDGEITPNGAGASTSAEVCYFVRSGNLYRRQLLIREPLAATGSDTEQPTNKDGLDFFAWNTAASPPAPAYYDLPIDPKNFMTEFDYSAFSRYEITQRSGAGFVGISALNNEFILGTPVPAVPNNSVPVSLGQSRFRFGFDPLTGLPREFGDAGGSFFIGRFTQEETSASNFKYPHTACEVSGGGTTLGSGNPMDAAGTTLTDAVDETGFGVPDGRVDEFQRNSNTGVAAGPRVGEDLLLTNVHEFRIDVWDQRLGQYLPIGHSVSDSAGTAGDFHSFRNLNTAYAPTGGSASIFDTWHPAYDRDDADGDFNDTTGVENPPFRPMTWDPLGISAPVPFNSGPDAFWDNMTDYQVGEVVFPPTEDADLNGYWDPATEDTIPNGKFDESGSVPVNGRVYYYQCVEEGTRVGSAVEPPWGSTPGQYHRTSDGYLWQVKSNLRPLKAIRITVRFLHRRSGKMRQMTLIQPLTK